jgi:N,N'-diacetyllegionaminate synthase
MQEIKIGNREIGKFKLPYTVVEAGLNHNGEIETAFKMIDVTKKSGADAIKFQTFKATEFISDPNSTLTYKSQGREVTESQLEFFKRMEFSREDWEKIKRKCDETKITFLSSAQNKTDLDLLLELGVSAVKVGSDDLNNIPLLKEYCTTGIPLILSCGMANLAEIHETMEEIGALEGYPTILLVCTSEYPAPPIAANLLRFETLSEAFPMIPLGFSDHTQGHLASTLAVGLGSCIFEKHFTLSRDMPGPDHWFAEDPASLKIWIDSINQAYTMLGSRIVKPTKNEEELKKIARRSIVAIKDIEQGEELNKENIGLKRPGEGLPPRLFFQVIGKKSIRKIVNGNQINFGDFK